MKKINLFSMAAAFLLAATGCSDDLEGNGNNQGEPIDGNGVYLSVNIMTPSTNGAYTKAGEEGTTSSNPSGGENGDNFLSALEKEYTVKDVTIVLYGKEDVTTEEGVKALSINDPDVRVIATAYGTAESTTGGTTWPNHEQQKATVRLNSEYLKKNTYYRILAIANADERSSFPAGAKLADCKIKTIANHQTGTGNDEKFIMSTHVEKNKLTDSADEVHSIVSFNDNNKTETDAATGTVWVERLSARIDYVGTKFEFNVNSKEDPSTKLATVTLQGVAPVNVAKHPVYIFKHLTEASDINGDLKALIDETYTSGTNANYVIEPTTTSRTGVTATKQFNNPFTSDKVQKITYTAFNDLTLAEEGQNTYRIICYTGENTMAYNQQTHGRTTGVIFKAKYDPEKLFTYSESNGTVTESTSDANKGFYRVDNKLYQGLEAAEAELIFNGTDDETNPLVWLRKNFTKNTWELGAISFADLKAAVATAATRKDLGYLKFLSDKLSANGVTEVDATTMNWTEFLKENTALKETDANWKMSSLSSNEIQTIEYFDANHTCYYPYWIRHANNGDDETMGIMEFCIVRNNVYRLNVTNIEGLGMADPFDSENKPNEGEEEGYYLNVELYVHDWVVRNNGSITLKPGN
ncbi:MAG: hypothetical protein PARBB_00896 [Parabacteroides distasonis]